MGIIILSLVIGVAVGSLSGLVGIGGGVLLVPILLYVYHLGMHAAAGTSLSIVLPLSLVGAIAHISRGNVDLRLTVLIGIGTIGGVLLGSWAGSSLPDQSLKKVFAIILLLISLRTLADAYGIQLPASSTGPKETGTAIAAPSHPSTAIADRVPSSELHIPGESQRQGNRRSS